MSPRNTMSLNVRHTVLYTLALAATGTGIWMIVGAGRPAPIAAAVSPAAVVTPVAPDAPHGASGGYMGTGRPQVTLEAVPEQVAKPPRTGGTSEVQAPRQIESERRMEELRRVLANIEGEPVYVEGIDGPAPSKKPEKNPPLRR